MAVPDLALVKLWCRIDGSEFDAMLPTMISAATSIAGHITGVDYTTHDMPPAVQEFVAANVSYWLDNPAGANEKAMEPAPFLARLLDPYKTWA